MKNRFVLAAACAAMAAPWLAAGAQTVSLAQALQSARTNDPKYQVALREFEGTREYRIAGKAARLPDVSASASAARNTLEQRVGSFTRDTNYTSASLAVQLRQPLYAPELDARAAIGEARSQQGEAQLALRDAELIQRLVDAYVQVVVLRGQLGATDALIQALDQQSRGAERMTQLGEGTRTDILEARSRLLLSRAQKIEIEDGLRDARRRLATVIGGATPPAALTATGDSTRGPQFGAVFAPLSLVPSDLAGWEATTLDNNPQLRVARRAAEAAQAELVRTDAQRKPRVDALATVQRSDSDSVSTLSQTNTQASIGVQLSIPLYTGGRIDSASRLAAAQAAQAQAEMLDAQESALADARLFYSQVQSTASRVQALVAARESAALQVQATRQSVKGGIRITLDVLNAENQQYEVERDLIRARADHIRAWVKLRAVAGVANDADLARLDESFEGARP